MRIVFMGTPDFAVESLKALYENQFNIVGVITAPDKPAGRGRKISQSAVKQYADQQGLKTLQPTNLKDPEFIEELKSLKADLQIVVAFRMLPEIVWNMPAKGTFNLHGSLLPQYRGAAPINWAIMNGEKKTGVTTFFLKKDIDTGDIIDHAEIEISENDNVGTIHDKLMLIGADLVVKTVKNILAGTITTSQQDHLDASELKHAPKIFKPDCQIDFSKDIEPIYNHIRGLSPYPAAFLTFKNGDKEMSLKVFEVTKSNETHTKPIFESDNKTFLKVKFPSGSLELKNIQLSGKKRMNIEDMLRGFNGDFNSCEITVPNE